MQNKGIVKFIAVLLVNQQREGVYGHLFSEAVP